MIKNSHYLATNQFANGRDSLYFSNKYGVYVIDPIEEFCNHIKQLGLNHVFCQTIQQMQFENIFDGILACTLLLHIPSIELNEVFNKRDKALKTGGIILDMEYLKERVMVDILLIGMKKCLKK